MQRRPIPFSSKVLSGVPGIVLPLAMVVALGCGSEGTQAGGADTGTAAGDTAASAGETPAGLTPDPEPGVLEDALVRALDEQLTVWKRPDGSRIHIAHCRSAKGGCRARIEALAELLVDAGRKHAVDPFLLAAMAIRESGLHPEAVGIRGSGGILQLHPHGVGADVRIVRDARYRRQCRTKPAACQGPVIDIGAKHLAEWIEHCGELRTALGGYNSGKCQINNYPRKVLTVREKLETYARREIVESDQKG